MAGSQIDLPAEAMVAMDQSVWEPSLRIRWPDPEDRQVHVFYAVGDAASALALSLEQTQKLRGHNNAIWMGEHNQRLAVMFHDELLVSDPTTRRFVTEHEVFHLAAQYYGVRVGMNRLKSGQPEHPDEVSAFWDTVLRTSLATGEASACGQLESRFSALSANDQNHVLQRAFWEWPAEFYARSRVFGLDNDARYLDFRRRLSPGDTLYFAGGVAMAAMARDATQGDPEWQRRIEDGINPLNIVMESMGCQTFADDGGVGRITKVNFVD